jgi:hypothetical protein
MGKRRNPEQQLQIAVADYLRLALWPPAVWSAIGHGGGGKVRGAILKAMGLRAGMPDVVIILPYRTERPIPVVIGLELKAKAGRQSPEQKAVEKDWNACGGFYHVCRSVDEVEGFLRRTGVPLRASVA